MEVEKTEEKKERQKSKCAKIVRNPLFVIGLFVVVALLIGIVLVSINAANERYNKNMNEDFIVGSAKAKVVSYCLTESNHNPYKIEDNMGNCGAENIWFCVETKFDNQFAGINHCLSLNYHVINHGVSTNASCLPYQVYSRQVDDSVMITYCFKVAKTLTVDLDYEFDTQYTSEQNKGFYVRLVEQLKSGWEHVKIKL